VASASADGAPYLVPLSFDWDGEALLMATPTDSPTGRNLAASRAVRLGWGSCAEHDPGQRQPDGRRATPGRHCRSDRQRTVAATAPAKENQTYCSKLVRSSQPTPTETATGDPA
jgi:hypothetical protein